MLRIIIYLAIALSCQSLSAQNFSDWFEDNTLRLDYVFAGDSAQAEIFFEQAFKQKQWAGRRCRLSEMYQRGNGQVRVYEKGTNNVLYCNSFSTLFQEWQATEEATRVRKCFETSYLVPFPKKPVDVCITLTDFHNRVTAELRHPIDPKDILIRPIGDNGTPYKYIWRGGDITSCIDLAFVAEGYTAEQMDKFYKDVQRATDAIFSFEPFTSLKNRFNIVAVASPSADSGPCIPRMGQWKRSAMSTHYDTFYSDRYLMTSEIHRLYDLLSGVPFENIFILVNSPTYGGGGIYNQVTVATTDHSTFREIVVHEFGHGYAGLADEYFYDDQYTTMYPADTEPWEKNLTTLVDFQSKWADLVPKKTPVPTPPNPKVPNFKTAKTAKELKKINDATQVIGVFEGGGYQSKGVYRPAQECRMKINEVEDFCPVCNRTIRQITDFYTAHE
ncbi:MAG: peptidase M64 [Bacteroidaceae bacterium]|nr:peptidase M64 [Bacteroidaceae bacterium]